MDAACRHEPGGGVGEVGLRDGLLGVGWVDDDMVVGMATGEDMGNDGSGQGAAIHRAVLGRGLDTKGGTGLGAHNEGMAQRGTDVGAGVGTGRVRGTGGEAGGDGKQVGEKTGKGSGG